MEETESRTGADRPRACDHERRCECFSRATCKEFSLPNIFQLVKMSAKTGALTIRREGESGKIFFRNGLIYYAYLGAAAAAARRAARQGRRHQRGAAQGRRSPRRRSPREGARIGAILLEQGRIDRATLEQAVREQIQDTAFNFFSWRDGEFEFSADESPTDEDILVEMNVENVIMEGCRRIDEWELIFEQLGSLERVPHLAYGERVDERGELTLTAEEWRVSSTSTAAPTSTPSCASAASTASTAPRSSTACSRAGSSASASR